MKSILLVICLFVSASALADQSVYGWDILCKGSDNLIVHASQSDDDFYINSSGGKQIPSVKDVYAQAWDQMALSRRTLLFSGVEYTKDRNSLLVSLTVVREGDLQSPGLASGVLNVDGSVRDLKCYVRFGIGEDNYDDVIAQPFPNF